MWRSRTLGRFLSSPSRSRCSGSALRCSSAAFGWLEPYHRTLAASWKAPTYKIRTPGSSNFSIRSLSTSRYPKVRILYASQGGTAQLFAMQLQQAIEEADGVDVEMDPWNAVSPESLLSTDPSTLHVFITSTAGVGEPPDNGRDFYEYITDGKSIPPIRYAAFGLGNQKAHPNHYNVVAKSLCEHLNGIGAEQVLPLTLGDDGDCLEDDFDQWQEKVIAYLFTDNQSSSKEPAVVESTVEKALPTTKLLYTDCAGAKSGQRRISERHAPLQLEPGDPLHLPRVHLEPIVYPDGSQLWTVEQNQSFNTDPVSNGLYEMRLVPKTMPMPLGPLYETGDHFLLRPRNMDCVVEAYLNHVLDDVEPSAVIVSGDNYPHPTGLTIYETLSHWFDLSSVPSPSFARFLLDRSSLDYKAEVAVPRRTILDLVLESGRKIALEDLLYQATPLQGRFYSIASSATTHPQSIILTYRPVEYLTERGVLRQGLATSYMQHCHAGTEVVAKVCRNPTFRLPEDPSTPIALLAGGCGVAPIRAFLEERLAMVEANPSLEFGPAVLFLGFRNPADQVYGDLVERAMQAGAITEQYVTFTAGCLGSKCGLVSDAVRQRGRRVFELLHGGGHVYVCGGARTFGVAIENELHSLLQEHGGLDAALATKYLQDLTHTGRLHEDLAD